MKERQRVEQLWASEKYRVMSYDQNSYNIIRKKMALPLSYDELQLLITQALSHKPTSGSVINAFQHMWGYFKKVASDEEKALALDLIAQYKRNDIEMDLLWRFLATLAKQYNTAYLLQSTLLKPYV